MNYIDKQFKTFQNILSQNNSKNLLFYLDLVYNPIRVAAMKKIPEKNKLLFLDVYEFFPYKTYLNVL